MYIHIDSDSLLYKAAGSLQQTVYTATDGSTYENLPDLLAAGHTEHTKEFVLKEPESQALDSAVFIVTRALENIYKEISVLWPRGDYVTKTYISSSTNFRLSICPQYKANRTQPKPLLLKDLKQWVLRRYAPIIMEGYEADDVCSSAHVTCQRAGVDSVLVHIDKDLDTVVGTHYNPDKKLAYTITPAQALLNYYRQVLMGDATDNVIGIKGIGPAKTAKALPLDLADTHCNKKLQKYLDSTVKEYYISSGRLADFAKNKQLLKMITDLKVDL